MKFKLLYLITLFTYFTYSQEKVNNQNNTNIVSRLPEDPEDPNDPIEIDPDPYTPTTLTPPIKSGEVGFIKGDLSVSNSGGANYSISLKMPSGINNVSPKISINYNSQSNDGILGYGWNIGGISKISRIPSTNYYDGKIDPIDYDGYDRFALDGQRLILNTGVYGNIGSTYVTEMFSNLKITLMSGSGFEWFLIEYPDGSIAKYGIDSNSNNQVNYYINSWHNPQGLCINYNYIKQDNNSLISSILYGGINVSSHMNEIFFNYVVRNISQNTIVYDKEIKNDKILSDIKILSNGNPFKNYYFNYSENSTGYNFLDSIIEKTGDNTKELFPINFNYDTTPLDVTITTSGMTAINWFEEYYSSDFKTSNYLGFTSSDFDGNGKTDLIKYLAYKRKYTYEFLTNPDVNSFKYIYVDDVEEGKTLYNAFKIETNFPVEQINPINFLSENGGSNYVYNSKSAWSVISNDFTNNKIFFDVFSKSNLGENLEYQKVFNYPTGCIDSNGNNTKPYYEYFYGDFNGDKLTDVIAVNRNNYFYTSGEPISVNCNNTQTSNGATFFIDLDKRKNTNYVNFSGNIGFCKNDVGFDVEYNKRVFIFSGDVNNDGKTDLICARHYSSDYFNPAYNSIEVYSLDDNNNLVLIGINDNISHNFTRVISGDFNGDGQIDLILGQQTGGTMSDSSSHIYTWKDDKFSYSGKSIYPLKFVRSVGDFNNDGKTDLLFCGNYAYPNNQNIATVFGFDIMNTGGAKTIVHGYTNIPNIHFTINDISTGSNLLVGLNSIQASFINLGNDISRDKLLKSIDNGNIKEYISYNENENGKVYSRNSINYNFPYYSLPENSNLKLVSQIRNEYLGYLKKQNFKYENYMVNFESNNFIGFKATSSTNWFINSTDIISTVNKFDFTKKGANIETFSMVGLIEPNYNLLTTDSFIARTLNTYNYEDTAYVNPLLSNKIFKLFKTKTENFNGLTGTSSITNVNYNSYNNPINSTTIIKNGVTIEKTSTNTFNYDAVISSPYMVDRLNSKISNTTIQPSGDVHTSEEQYIYDINLLKQIKKRTTNSGLTSDFITEYNQYDIYGNLIQKKYSAPSMIDRITNYEYDTQTHRFIVKKIDSELQETLYEYDQNTGLLLSETAPSNPSYPLKTTYIYDKWGKVTKITDYLGKSSNVLYYNLLNSPGYLKIVLNGDDNSTKSIIDPLGRVLHEGYKTIEDKWSVKSTIYNIYDQPIHVTGNYFDGDNANVWNEMQYDIYGRLTQSNHLKTSSSPGKVTTYSYNGLTTVENDGQKTKTTIKNAIGEVISLEDSPGEIVTYQYFANGNLKKAITSGSTIEIQQDAFGRKKTLIDPSAGTRNYEYNKFGELTKEEVVGKGFTEFNLDNNGKLLEKKITESGVLKSKATYGYNANKQLSTIVFNDYANSTTTNYTYDYDDFKRLILNKEIGSQFHFEQRTAFDAFGRPEKKYFYSKNLSDNKVSSKWIKHEYKNGFNWKMYDMTNPFTVGAVLWETKQVNENGDILSASLKNNSIFLNKAYDIFGFPTQIKYSKNTSDYMIQNTEFDPIYGNLTKRTSNLFGTTWTEDLSYDQLDRLTTWKDNTGIQTQTYNGNGTIDINKLGSYAYSIANKPFQLSSITPQFPSSVYNYYANREQNITYNINKKPISITELTAENIDFEYNPMDSRSVMYYGDLQSTKTNRIFRKFYSADGSMELKRNINTNQVEFITYVQGGPYNSSIVLKSNGTTQEYLYLLKDYQGTINGIVNATGNLIEKRQFDVWGSLINFANASGVTTVPTTANSMVLDRGYTSHEHLLGVNIINMNGRIYDYNLHKFLQPDNYIQDFYNTQNYNRYGYVLNNPTKYTDESGEMWFWQVLAGAIFNAYASGYQSSGDLNPFNWGNTAWTNAGLGLASGVASGAATYYADNYISNYGNNNLEFEFDDQQNSNFINTNNSLTEDISIRDFFNEGNDIHEPFQPEPFVYEGMTTAESDAMAISNFAGGVFFSEASKFVKEQAKLGRYDVLNKVDFLNDMSNARGWVYNKEILKYSKYLSTYGGGFANALGYVGAADKMINGNKLGGTIDGISNTISIRLGMVHPLYGAAWSFGWWLGEKSSQTEIYNRILFGTDSSIYKQREIFWYESKVLKK